MEELYKKDIHDPDNHDGVITHLEPDILECEFKQTLGSITLLACEINAIVQQFEHSLAFPFFGIGMKSDLFQSCGHC